MLRTPDSSQKYTLSPWTKTLLISQASEDSPTGSLATTQSTGSSPGVLIVLRVPFFINDAGSLRAPPRRVASSASQTTYFDPS